MASPLPPEPAGVTVRVPAKINLALRVGPRGADGFHPLATVFQAISLYDDVTATWAEPGEFAAAVAGEGADTLPTGSANLAVRAAQLLAKVHGRDDRLGAALSIKKSIPVAAGLAGGSADAAGALLACAVLWDVDVEPNGLAELAAQIGSDAPFPLLGGTAIGTGRGTVLAPVLTRGSYHWVLAVAASGLSTATVYTRFDARGGRSSSLEVPDELLDALRSGRPDLLAAHLVNDLQPVALELQPRLRRTLDAGRELGALGALVCGSGPTAAFLAVDESAAIDLSVALSAEGICRSVRRATGPVPGARLVS